MLGIKLKMAQWLSTFVQLAEFLQAAAPLARFGLINSQAKRGWLVRHVCAKYPRSCTAEMLDPSPVSVKSPVRIVNGVVKLGTCVRGVFSTEV